MKSSKAGSRKTASSLPESIHQHLNMYAIAAGAAGVSLLALVQPSLAKIVYTPAKHVIGRDQTYPIDLNHDGTSDVAIQQVCIGCVVSFPFFNNLLAEPAQGNGIEEGAQGHGWAAALRAGATIGYTKQFNDASEVVMRVQHGRAGTVGYWNYAQPRYLGVKFQINGKTHFGWTRFKNSSPYGATLTGYAYETTPGKSIKAGQIREAADDPTNDDFGPDASLTTPIPDTPQPASLGMLALGAQGVPLRRRKESALEGDLKGALL
jgi:hypothetical protein